jgi:hypothetical protein
MKIKDYLKLSILFFIMIFLMISSSSAYISLHINAEEKGSIFPLLNRGFNQGEESKDPYFLYPIQNRLKEELGVKIIRIDHLYDSYVKVYYEDNQIKADFKELDKYIRVIIDMGAKPLMCLSYMPYCLQLDKEAKIASPPKSYEDWKKLVKMTILRYNKEKNFNIKYWEVWNEPENKTFNFWKGRAQKGESLDNLIKLYKYSVEGIEEAEEEGEFKVKVGGFGLAGCTTHIVERLKDEGVRFDFISWHHYGNISGKEFNLRILKEEIDKMRSIVGDKVELLITEWNASVKDSLFGRMVNRSHIGASYAASALNLMIENNISVACFSQIRENYSASNWALGLFYPDYRFIKPVFNVFKMYHRLEEYKININGFKDRYITGGIATKNQKGDLMKIIIWHRDKEKELFNLTLDNLRFDKIFLKSYLIDQERSNGKYFEEDTAYPKELNESQELELFHSPNSFFYGEEDFNNGRYNISFYLNPYSVILLEIKGEVIPLQITASHPIDGSRDKINIEFNVMVDKVGFFALRDQNNSLISGELTLFGKYLSFLPYEELSSENSYNLILKNIESYSKSMIKEYIYSFTIPVEKEEIQGNFSPVCIIPSKEEEVIPTNLIQIIFNHPVDGESVTSENIKFYKEKKLLYPVISPEKKSKAINIFLSDFLQYKRNYTLNISSNIRSIEGENLSQDYLYNFRMIDYPKVSFNLAEKEDVPLNSIIELYFKDKVLWEATLSPKLIIYKEEMKKENIWVDFSLLEWKRGSFSIEKNNWKLSFDVLDNKIVIYPPNKGVDFSLEEEKIYYLKLVDGEYSWFSSNFKTSSDYSLNNKELVVIEKSPLSNEKEVELNPDIYVIFNTELDSNSIDLDKAITLYHWGYWDNDLGDYIGPGFLDGEVFYERDKKKLSFVLKESLTYNTTYELTLDQNIKNIYGNSIGYVYKWSFSTKMESESDFPQVIYRYPKPEQENVPLDCQIIVEFDKDIENVSLASFNVVSLNRGTLLNGELKKEIRRIIFIPNNGELKIGDGYKVYLSKDLGLEEEVTWNFYSPKYLFIKDIYPSNDNVPIDCHIIVQLNEMIREDSILNFTLRDDKGYIEGKIFYGKEKRKIIFIPQDSLNYSTKYEVFFALSDEDNNYVSRSFSFTTKKGLTPIRFYPSKNEEDVSINCDIGAKFNQSLDKDYLLRENIILILENNLIDIEITYREESKELFIHPKILLDYGKKYKVILKNLRSLKGDFLNKEFSWSFYTKNIPLLLIKEKKTSKKLFSLEGESICREDKILDETILKSGKFRDFNQDNILIMRRTASRFNLEEIDYNPFTMYPELIIPYRKEVEELVGKVSNLKIFYIDDRDKSLNIISGRQILDRENRKIFAYPSKIHSYYLILESVSFNDLSSISVYPNPFNPLKKEKATFISLPEDISKIKIYNINGEVVRILEREKEIFPPRAFWDGRNQHGYLVASGIYLYVVEGNNKKKVGKIAIIK